MALGLILKQSQICLYTDFCVLGLTITLSLLTECHVKYAAISILPKRLLLQILDRNQPNTESLSIQEMEERCSCPLSDTGFYGRYSQFLQSVCVVHFQASQLLSLLKNTGN